MVDVERTLRIVELVNTLAQVALDAGLSLNDLVKDKAKANSEGRVWGRADVEELIKQSRLDVDAYNRLVNEGPNNG